MDVLKTGIGMDVLAELDRGWGLGNLARDAFAGSGGALILRATDVSVPGLVEAGRGLMRLWFEATRRGLAIHPWGSPFLFQHLLEDPSSLTEWERSALAAAAGGFELDVERPILLVLRVSRHDEPPRVRSLRRSVQDVLGCSSTSTATDLETRAA